MDKCYKILVVDDEKDSRDTYKMLLESRGYKVEIADTARHAIDFLKNNFCHIVVTDIMMPGMNGLDFLREAKDKYQDRIEVIMATGYGTIESAVEAMKRGAFGYFVKSHSPDELLAEIKKAEERLDMTNIKDIKKDMREKYLLESHSSAMKEVWRMVKLVSDSSANVLITGESGTGKEIIAEEIHRLSRRNEKPFIAINCQQYPHGLIESELFGHEKGAYTSAVSRRIGKLEQASGGTVFFDEIGDLSIETQTMLLRVLERKEIERIGANTVIPVNFRLLSATNRPLEKMVREGSFRQDFLYRINTIEIRIPPLRERREDIPAFISYFIKKYEKETGKKIKEMDKTTREWLLTRDYPGNIRELRNIIERLVILSGESGIISASASLQDYPESLSDAAVSQICNHSYREAKANFEKMFITSVLGTTNGNITKAAEKIGLSRRQLFNKIVEFGIDVSEEKK